jgi:demethylmenaquinone methyltransferase/2-methoxy-6-polyprenyl-1,4-benzoquinol methylase
MADTDRVPGAIRRMFGEIAPRYDLLNRLMTLGQDVRWRKRTVEILAPTDGGCYLDVGTGTGDLATELRRQAPKAHIIGVDFAPQMLQIAQGIAGAGGPVWMLADGEGLPFATGTFDGALSGFFIRNVGHLSIALQEQRRVLRPGGRIVVLETSPPKGGLTRWFHRLHLRLVIPLLGRFVAGNAPAYRYLSATTREFLHPEAVSEALRAAGFEHAGFEQMTLGAVAIHSARKPGGS